MSACELGPPAQTPDAQYPCPGGCGCWVADGNVPCLPCWYRANRLSPRVARTLPPEHPRRPRPAPCPECSMDLAMRGHDSHCPTNRLDRQERRR